MTAVSSSDLAEQEEASRGRRRAKRGQGQQLRVQIMDVAERLLVEKGSEDAVSIREIARAIGITSPSVYLHFADKDELFDALCNRRFEELGGILETARNEANDPLDALTQCGRAYFMFGLQHPEQYAFLMRMRKSIDSDDEEWSLDPSDPGIGTFLGLVGAVDKCIEAGLFREVDSFKTATTLWMAMHGATSLLITMPKFPFGSPEEVIDRVLDTQIHGLLVENRKD